MVCFLMLHLACIASRKKCCTLYNKTTKKPYKTSTAYISICCSTFWYKLLCFVNVCGRSHGHWNISASSECYKIEMRSAVLMKKKKTTSVHITGYSTLALYFCILCEGLLINSQIHTHAQTHTDKHTHTHAMVWSKSCSL